MDNSQAVSWVLLPNVGGLAGLYIIRTKHDELAQRCPAARVYPGSCGQVALWALFNSAIGYAAFLVFREGRGLEGPARPCVAVFAVGLCHNWAWPPFFYSRQKYAVALVDMGLLCGVMALLARLYFPISQRAAKLMLPCLAWTLFVATFNFRVWRYNRHRQSSA